MHGPENPEKSNGKLPPRWCPENNHDQEKNIKCYDAELNATFEGIKTATGEERGREPNRAAPDDVPDLNPQGAPVTDERSIEKHRLSCRVGVRIGRWNVRSMYDRKIDVVKREI